MRLRVLIFAIACGLWVPGRAEPAPDIIASNAFYYYEDVEVAWRFYRDTLGFETVVDYGFAKIMRLAESSYVTLVRASEGMHSADEPKTVLLTLQSTSLSPWLDLLEETGVPLMDDPVDSHAVLFEDPGGYLLRIEAHEEGPSAAGPQSAAATVRATVYTLYVSSLEDVSAFYGGLLDRQPQHIGNNTVQYAVSASGYIALQQGFDGRLRPTATSAVTLSFLTTDVDAWFARAKAWPGFELRTPEVLDEGGLVRVFVGYDPAGSFLEWDTFLPVAENARLLHYLPR